MAVYCIFNNRVPLRYHLITINVPVAWHGRNDFDAGNFHYESYWKGVGPEIETFLGPEMATSGAILARKVESDFITSCEAKCFIPAVAVERTTARSSEYGKTC